MIIGIRNRTGNLEEDFIQAIINLKDEKFENIINTIENDEDFDKIVDKGLIVLYGGPENNVEIPLYRCLEYASLNLKKYAPISKEYERLKILTDLRSQDTFLQIVKDETDKAFSNIEGKEAIEILSDSKKFDEFLKLESSSYNKAYYQNLIVLLFNIKNEMGNQLIQGFNVQNLEEAIKNYEYLQKYIEEGKGSYRYAVLRDFSVASCNEDFSGIDYIGSHTAIREDEEPDWELNEEIKNAVYEGMPDDLSLEEKAIYIYEKMCKIFKYDENYIYRNKINRINYTSTFSASHLQSITPNTKITCFDFSRIYVKLVNELKEDIEAVILSQDEGHYCAGFSTARCSAKLEAINLIKNDEGINSNDLTRAKTGEKLSGIYPISDKFGLIDKAIDRTYPIVQEKAKRSINDILNDIKAIPREDYEINEEIYLNNLIDNCKKLGLSNNEFTVIFNNIYKMGFLGDKFNYSFLGEMCIEYRDIRYKRFIWLREKDFQDGQEPKAYLIDTDSLELSTCTDKDMKERLEQESLIYESNKRKMPGFDKEV